ncbi:MAG: hypothetical protein GY869_31045 [Planctomycetes bacterium]|nr:hypothetical protein [Planctomycetota bacterium]
MQKIIISAVLLCAFGGILLAYFWKATPVTSDSPGLNATPESVESAGEAFDGYTLFAPISSTTTYLVDMDGNLVHSWESEYPPGQSAYLLKNGNLLRTASIGNGSFGAGGAGGRIQEFTWEGELVWDFEYSSGDYLLHHDIERLPNGNVLMIAWERKSSEQVIIMGRDPEIQNDHELWVDYIVEVKPTGKTTGDIVWEWHIWDHLIQDQNSDKPNYGSVSGHPERVNINTTNWSEQLLKQNEKEWEKLKSLGYLGASTTKQSNPDWTHTNSIAYNAKLDQIAISVLGFNEIWIIDHSTNTEQAAGAEGGKYGKGGDLLYRWGNPLMYRRGRPEDQQLFSQHDVHWIPKGAPGAGNLLVFNNGRGRADCNYSSVDEIAPPVDEPGNYILEGGQAYGPEKPVWSYTAATKEEFFSSHISGAQRLANGNTLICSGESGTIFEVTLENETVWNFVNPIAGMMMPGGRPGGAFGGPGMNQRGMNFRGPPPGMGPPGIGPPGMGRGMGMGMGSPGMGGPPPQGMGMAGPGGGGPGGGSPNMVFRAYRYSIEYPGLAGKDLTSQGKLSDIAPSINMAGFNQPFGMPPMTGGASDALIRALDTDKDGQLSAGEIENATEVLKSFDKNNDGKLTPDEWRLPE